MIKISSLWILCALLLFTLHFKCLVFATRLSDCPSDNADLSSWKDPATWNGNLPVEGEDVVVDKPILLDTETPRLGAVTIATGGVLVFSPNETLTKLVATRILINGELWIGSEDCPFLGNAEIFIIGMYNSTADNPSFGQKFIGIPSGGTLELHGKEKLHWTRLTSTVLSSTLGANEVVLNVEDDASLWEPNDQIVVASSSFNWTEAEVVTVLQCDICSPTQVKVQGPFNHTHLGESTDGIDMRAEVGLLTRNIKIHAEMQSACYANMKCNEFPYDTFGGHVQVLKGFKNVHVEGVELYDMGQQYFLGRYPLHFHMDQEVGDYPSVPYFRSNSIHKSYSRCVTVHGTFGVTVSNHVCYNILGHSYYLEDGGEKNTTVENNLAIGTRTASLIPSDTTDVASFFISLPMTYVRNNVAAGSEGHGFLYIFPIAPVGASSGMNFLQPNQSMHTNVYEFQNNVAHSNAKIGLYFANILGPSHEVQTVSNDYNPLQDPLNANSLPVSTLFNGFTGYKNVNASVWVESAETFFNNFMISDSARGIVALSSARGPKHVDDSIVHGSIIFEDNVPSVQ